MAIVVVAYSVFVRNSTLDENFPGGADGWRTSCVNKTFRSDERLCRVSFMTWPDVEGCLGDLRRVDIAFDSEDPQTPIAVVKQNEGLLHECEWLELRRLESGVQVAWDGECEATASTRAEGWDWDVEAANSMVEADESTRAGLEQQPGVNPAHSADHEGTYYVGRSYEPLTGEQQQEHDERYKRALRLAEPLIVLDDRDSPPLDADVEDQSCRASTELDRVLEPRSTELERLLLPGKDTAAPG